MSKPRVKEVALSVSLNKRQAQALRALSLPMTPAQWSDCNDDPRIIDVLFGGAETLDSQVLTPFGFKRMGDIRLGDVVACPDGTFSPVIAIRPRGIVPIYRVRCTDGAEVRVTGDHLWRASIVGYARKRNSVPGNSDGIYTTDELRAFVTKAQRKHFGIRPWPLIPLCQPIQFTIASRNASARWPIDPYALGVLIGDGSLTQATPSFTSADDHIIERMRSFFPMIRHGDRYNYRIPDGGTLHRHLADMDLCVRAEHKHIPERYKRAPLDIRWALMQGLMDTDGYADAAGDCSYTTVSHRLALDVQWIARSLGAKATLSQKQGAYHKADGTRVECQIAYIVAINMPNPERLFSLPRKRERAAKPYNGGLGQLKRRIISIEPDGEEEAQCITIRHPDGLYITDDFIVTHNSKGPGKAVRVSTPIPIPSGWTTMGELRVGSQVYSADGSITTVIGVTPVDTDSESFEVVFNTGDVIVADARHKWHTWTLAERAALRYRTADKQAACQSGDTRRPIALKSWSIAGRHPALDMPTGGIRTTAEIAQSLRAGGKLNAINHAVETAQPLSGIDAALPVEPYLLGLWLADGLSGEGVIGKMDADWEFLLSHISWPIKSRKPDSRKSTAFSYVRFAWLTPVLRKASLLDNKHIPVAYLRASYRQRLALLQGIMDGDGSVDKDGRCEITQVRQVLADDIHDLVSSLGIITRVRVGRATLDGKDCGPKYRLGWTTAIPMFRLPRKLSLQKRTALRDTIHRRYIVDVRPVGKQPVRCIQVSHPSGMYLCGRSMIPTHNSWFLCVATYLYALEVARRFALPVSSDVPHVGWIGRKVAQVFTGTTLETWKSIIPSECYSIVAGSEKHPRHIRIADRIAIDYGGLDSRTDLERFNSAEYGWIAIDQAEETTKDDVAVLMASRRKRLPDPKTKELVSLPFRGLWTANPRQCWLKEEFVDHPRDGKVFVPAIPADNPHLPNGYLQTLEDSFSHRPDLLKAYRDGDWNALSGIDQIILAEWLTAAKIRVGRDPYLKRWVSVDPARFGDDSCVILGGENTRLLDARVLPACGEPQIVSEVEAMLERMGDRADGVRIPAIVEIVGVCGVGDYLRQHGRSVIEHLPAAAATQPDRFYNLRAEVWSTVGRWLQTGQYDNRAGGYFELPEPMTDPALRLVWQRICEQLLWPWYEFRGQKVLVAAKEDIKAMHSGTSPDYGDAYANGIYYLPRIPIQAHSARIGYERRAPARIPVLQPMGF